MRSAYEENPNMTQEEAVQLIEKCLKVLFYRDARSLNRVRMQRFSIEAACLSLHEARGEGQLTLHIFSPV